MDDGPFTKIMFLLPSDRVRIELVGRHSIEVSQAELEDPALFFDLVEQRVGLTLPRPPNREAEHQWTVEMRRQAAEVRSRN